MIRFFLVNLIFIIVSFTSFAQLFEVANEKKALEAKNKILLVRIYEKGDSDLKTYSNDEEIAAMQNEMLRNVFSSGWNLNETVEYLSKNEMKKRVEKDPEKYVVVDRSWGKDIMKSAKVDTEYSIFEVQYGFPKGKKMDLVFSMAFPDDALGELDYRFFISQCNEYLQAAAKGVKPKDKLLWDPEKNIVELEKGTLFLPEGSLTDELIEARNNYCGKIETLSAPDLYEKITSQSKDVIFMSIMWSYKKDFYSYILIDAETYDMKGIIGMGGFQINLGIPLGDRETSASDDTNDKFTTIF